MRHDIHTAVTDHRALIERIRAAYPAESEESLADTIEAATELDAALLADPPPAIERAVLGRLLDGQQALLAEVDAEERDGR